ncbi:HAD family hydrolase [Amphibacillus sediminis]|uniref:HAD family hydrolase n=1 Tax=Amphibacillus sediminis TaxID=360185 RepID=UPI00082C54A1|nr:Cof-type HAD-IIB family hydrolase [Amphibacillus sediminis]
MNNNIKLIALDLDGTLVNHADQKASERLVAAVKQAQELGVEVIIATGRHRSTSLPIAEQLGVEYLVTLNGGEIWTKDGNLLHRQAIDPITVDQILEVHEQYNTFYWLVSHERVYRESLPENYQEHQWIKFGFNVEDDATRNEMLEHFSKLDTIELSNSSLTNMELNAKGTHKAAGIASLLTELNLSFDQVMTIGDSKNDLKMIEAAGIGVAMGNAQEIVKEKANWITRTQLEDGAAYAIEELVLK